MELIGKPTPTAFYKTNLESMLRAVDVKDVVVTRVGYVFLALHKDSCS